MVRPEPVSPERPEQNDEYKFELVKAMGVAIAAIAKEKSVFITDAEVKRNTDDYWELEIRAVVPKDKDAGAEYKFIHSSDPGFKKYADELQKIKASNDNSSLEERYFANFEIESHCSFVIINVGSTKTGTSLPVSSLTISASLDLPSR